MIFFIFGWLVGTWDQNMHQEKKKIVHGKFFDFCADKYIYKRIPKDENPPMKGF